MERKICECCGQKIPFKGDRRFGERTLAQLAGIEKARRTKAEKMKTYCTKEAHAERVKTSESYYCDLCHKKMI